MRAIPASHDASAGAPEFASEMNIRSAAMKYIGVTSIS